MFSKNIVLIGFMGCGKTSIGKKLAYKLGREFIDTDIKIEELTNMEISEIFNNYGEDYFRKLEYDLCEKLSDSFNSIIATGGGIIKNDLNVKFLKKSGIIVYLKCSVQKIFKNIKYDNSRPLLNCGNKIKKIESLLKDREPMYEKNADIIIDISNFKIDESADIIIKKVELYEKSKSY